MKLYSLLSGILVFTSSAVAGPCAIGTLQDYVTLGAGGCQQGVVTFSGFSGATGQNGAIPISLLQVAVTPGGTQFMPTLQFTLNKTAAPNQLFESFFHFKASNSLFVGEKITLNSPTVTGDGADTATLDICPGAAFTGISTGCAADVNLIALSITGFAMLSDSASFTPKSFFDIFVDLTVDGGTGGGSAVFSSATVTTSATPEPGATQLVIAGLVAITLLGFRRNHLMIGRK